MTMLRMFKLTCALFSAAMVMVIMEDAHGLEPHECIELQIGEPQGARFFNKCNEMINMMYCVDHPASPKSCAAERILVTTLVPLAEEIVPDYSATERNAIFTAICAYPTAPVGWQPGHDAYECKKTCVMC